MAIPSQTNSAGPSRNQLIVSALCKRLNLDPNSFQDDISTKDIKDLSSKILKCSPSGAVLESNSEAGRWIDFAEKFPVDSGASSKALNELNESLSSKSVLVGEGLTPTEADIIVFSAIYSSAKSLTNSDRKSLPHLMRWIDYIQNKHFGEILEHILVEKDNFDPPARKVTEKVEANPNVKKTVEGKKDANNVEKLSVADAVKVKGESQTTTDKKKLPEKVADEKNTEVSVSLLKLQVGLIRKAWKHPSADSLLVEEIDTGDAKLRQVVSGLAKFCSPDELINRKVVLITNVKPGKLRDVMSEGLVLCASNEDHTVVEPLIPPEGAKVGECVSFVGYEGKPEDVLNPKKKQLEKITPHLFTDDKGVATFKGIPFMTSAGPCTSSIPKASIK